MSDSVPDMPRPMSRFRIYSRTDVGKRRQRNEDSLGVVARHGVFVVADGMGGVDGGDYCSRLVVDRMAEAFERRDPEELGYEGILDLVEQTIKDASAEIYEESENRGIRGMGTTVVAVCFDLETMAEACVLHVGDSRAYRRRGRELTAVTIDHSMAAESGIRDGDMVPMFMAGVITRAVGVRPDVEVDRTLVEVCKGDGFLLCSDGLYNMVPEAHMSMLLSREGGDPAADLVNAANEAGGFDNITVVYIEAMRGAETETPGNLDDTVV